MKKFLFLFIAIAIFTFAVKPALAAYPEWNISGTWNSQHEFNGTFYTHENHVTEYITSTDPGLSGYGGWNGEINGVDSGGSNSWIITNMTSDGPSYVSGIAVHFNYEYNSGENCKGHVDASINPLNGSLTGTWHDNCYGERSGGWTTNAGVAKRTCQETGFYRDGINMTAAIINPTDTVSGDINASGCNIGIYFGPGRDGIVSEANVFGSNYYGIVNHQANVIVRNSSVHDIGENPLNGSQHGIGIYFANVLSGPGNQPACDISGSTTTGEIKNNNIQNYQKGGIVINCSGSQASIVGNTVTGAGQVNWIAQNGIQVSRGAVASIVQNDVSGNDYIPASWSSTGILVYGSSNVKVVNNYLHNNDVGVDIEGAIGYQAKNNKLINNKFANNELSYYVEDGQDTKIHANVE